METEAYSTETEEIIYETPDISIETEGELEKSIQKPKKPRTEKQIEALKKARETRARNLKAKQEAIAENFIPEDPNEEYSQEIKDNEEYLKQQAISEPKKRVKKQPKIIYQDFSEESEEEVIVIKKPKRKKKKKQKVIYKEASSESEEEEVIEKVIQKPKRKYQKKVSLRVDSDSEEDAYVYPVSPRDDEEYGYYQNENK